MELARLEAQPATPVGEPVAGCGPSSTLQQTVNQKQLERDSLSQELRRVVHPRQGYGVGMDLLRLSSSVPGGTSQRPRRKLPRHSARKVHEKSKGERGCAIARRGSVTQKGSPSTWGCSRCSSNHPCDSRRRSESLACHCRRVEKGACL